MDVNQFETVSEALNYLIKEGYSHNFEISQNIARCIETNKSYKIILTGGLSHLFKNSLNVKTQDVRGQRGLKPSFNE